MASLRTGSGLPARPSEGRAQRLAEAASLTRGIPRPVNVSTRGDPNKAAPKAALARAPPPPPSSSAPQSRLPSRVPQPSSARQMSRTFLQQESPKSALTHQPTSWGSDTTPSSRTNSHTQSGSGSSTSSKSYENKNIPRRKNISVSRTAQAPLDKSPPTTHSSSLPQPRSYFDRSLGIAHDGDLSGSPAGISDNGTSRTAQTLSQSPVIYPELDRYRNHQRPALTPRDQTFELPFQLSTQDLPPPTPASLLFSGSSSQLSASPSTKFSGSPGPGPYSRDTTPTSMSSQSPGLTAPIRLTTPKGRQLSPALTRPPVTRRRAGSSSNDTELIDPQGLAAVRESLTSSSSSSTVKDVDRGTKDRKPSSRLPPPPPSPPPRKSSQKFRKTRDEEAKPEPKPTPRSASSSRVASPQKPAGTSSRTQASALSPTRPAAPRRPSRDGAPNLDSQLLGPKPIVHSNLSSTSLPGDRRGIEVKENATTYHHTKNASTSQLPAAIDQGPALKTGTAPLVTKKLEVPETARTLRTPSPNIASSFRFPFFGRKKTTAESPQKDKKEKKEKKEKKDKDAEKKPAVIRKGPAAGTGHEGYGRVGAIRRRSASGNLAKAAANSKQFSQESLVSNNNDSFFADRMNPVIISGGGVIENRNASAELSRTESNQSLLSMESKAGTEFSTTSRAESRTGGQWGIRGPRLRATARRPSDSSDSDGVGMKSTLAFRRSVQRLRSSPDNPIRLPQPINTSGVGSSPMTSFDTSIMSDDSNLELPRDLSRGRDRPSSSMPKKLTKRTRSPRKWNLFGRNQTQKSAKKEEPSSSAIQPEEKKSVAFYTMMDASEQEEAERFDIQDVLRNADVYTQSPNHSTPDLSASPFPAAPMDMILPPPLQRVYHDTPPTAVSAAAQPQVYPPPPMATLSSGRPSRLQQVGRIPKVVSKRQDHHASPKSFSRPFRASLQAPPQPREYVDPESIAKGPSPPRPETSEPQDIVESPAPDAMINIEAPFHASQSARASPVIGPGGKEFLRFSPRKNSDGTSSSSGVQPFNGATAVIPHPDDPPAEDEVWDEYDDLLGGGDHGKPRLSTTSSKGIPFHLEVYSERRVSEKPMESPTIAQDSRKVSMHSMAPTVSSSYSADMTERIRAAFQPHPSPKTPKTPPEFKVDFEEQVDSRSLEKKSTTELKRRSLSPVLEQASDSSYSSSEEGSPLAQVNLRVGSMTVSKWLTFGHVLFSDVRHQLSPDEGSTGRHSILVIDGLGNDDWSFYAAETYPAATFFNLSPRAPLPTDTPASPTAFPLSPPNHHQIQYLSHLEKFPFAPQSFTSVVYRFPVAAPESHYRNVLAEARRVLKPGGYLELSILDVDLNNMGNHGRRAVRQLKERIHETTPETNLASTADLMVRQIGKAGFYNIRAARVGVPVASSIARANGGIRVHEAKGVSGKGSKKKDQPSLSEMMSDPSSKADENITKMVARVGRWWYTRCYESAADPTLASSIWSDKALLRECEDLGTSLKLMVCCGRAPDRVASV